MVARNFARYRCITSLLLDWLMGNEQRKLNQSEFRKRCQLTYHYCLFNIFRLFIFSRWPHCIRYQLECFVNKKYKQEQKFITL